MAKKKIEEETNIENNSLEQSLATFDSFDKDFAGFKITKSEINVINTGSPYIDYITGINGYPRGRITHIFGPAGAGKTFLAMIGVKNALAADPDAIAVWFDAENSFSFDWAKKLGIWSEDPLHCRIKVIKGNKGKDVFERIVGKITKDGFGNVKKTKNGLLDYIKEKKLNCPIIVIDSIADLIAPREEAAPVGGLTVAALPGFLTAELKRIASLIEEVDTAFVCINQVRQTIDEFARRIAGPVHHPGGENLAHKMSLNILCDKAYAKGSVIYEDENDENSIIGRKVKITIKKNRFAPAPRTCSTTLIFREGAGYAYIGIGDVEKEVVDLAIKLGLITQGGAWCTFNYNGKTDSFNGKEKCYEFYKNNKAELDILQNLIKTTKSTEISFADKEDKDMEDLLTSEEV